MKTFDAIIQIPTQVEGETMTERKEHAIRQVIELAGKEEELRQVIEVQLEGELDEDDEAGEEEADV